MRWLTSRLIASFRRRTGSALLVGLLASIVAVVAATTPILIRAVQQSALEHALSSVSTLQRTVIGDASSNDRITPQQAADRAGAVTAALGHDPIWTSARTYREQADLPLTWTDPRPTAGRPKQRIADIPSCTDLRFVTGRCPRVAGEAAIAQTTFDRGGIRLGDRITLKSLRYRFSVIVVGVYDAATAAGALQAHPSSVVSAPVAGLDPDLLLSRGAFTALQLPTTAFSIRSLRTDVPLEALPSVRSDLEKARDVPLTAAGAAASTNALTTLDALLDRIDGQRDAAAVILSVVAVGAFGLALLAFAAVAQRLGRVRATEWALPRLRGMSQRRRLSARLVGPLLALTAGTLVGTATAFAAATWTLDAAGAAVADSIPASLGIAAAAALGGAATFFAVSAAADRRPLDQQLHRATEPRELTRAALIGQAVIVVAALSSVLALVVGSGSGLNGAGVLAPVLVALASGFIGLRIALVVVRRNTKVVPSSLTALIVWRRSGRAPSLLVPDVLVAAAVALGMFVAVTSATADADADASAAASTAATTVLHVLKPTGTSLLSAVGRADPSGRHAMAAEELDVGDGTFRVIAVDSSRLAAVSTWRSDWAGMDSSALQRRLAPAVSPSVQLLGSRLTLDVEDIGPGPSINTDEAFVLTVSLQTPTGLADVPLGRFEQSGSRTFTASIPCAEGCTFASLSVRCVDAYPAPWSMHLVVAGMSTDVQPADRFLPTLRTGSWMSESGHVLDATLPISSTARPGSSGLALDLADTIGTDQPAVRIRDTVEPLPAVLGQVTTVARFPGAGGRILGSGVDGSALLLQPVGRASALPRLLGDGVLVDLRRMLPQTDRSSTAPDEQVWVNGDPATVEARLRAEHVTVLSTETLAAARTAERAEAGPLSARFALVGAFGALAVVLIALLGGRLIAVPERRRQWRSFAAAGVSVAQIRRLVAIEFLAPAICAVVVGTVAGAVTFLLALPHLPLTDAAPSAPPAGVLPPWALAALFPAGALVAVLVVTAIVSRAETRGLEPGDGA